MKKGIAAKVAGIDFADLDGDGSLTPEATSPIQAAILARPRSGVAAVERSVSVHHRLQEAQDRLKQFEEGKLVVPLDPARIRESRWKNRDPLAFDTAEFRQLKDEIREAGGNVQAVKVRPAGKDEKGNDVYEIVYGRRRVRACLELGLMVMAVVEEMTDTQAYLEMHRENRGREDLSPWEQGSMYQDALSQGLYPSMRKLAEALNVSPGNMTVAIQLAELPVEVLAAFPSPLELQFRWALPLHKALRADPERVLRTAEAIRAEPKRASSKVVFERLAGLAQVQPISRDLKKGKKSVGKWERGENGAITMKVKAGVLTKDQERQVFEFVMTLLR